MCDSRHSTLIVHYPFTFPYGLPRIISPQRGGVSSRIPPKLMKQSRQLSICSSKQTQGKEKQTHAELLGVIVSPDTQDRNMDTVTYKEIPEAIKSQR